MNHFTSRVGMLVFLGALSFAQQSWQDGFEGYAPGTKLDGVGGWRGFNGQANNRAVVSAAKAFTGSQSIELKPDADIVQELEGPVAGRWTVLAHVYVPSTATMNSAFVLFNRYEVAGPKRWAGQIIFDSSLGQCFIYDGANHPKRTTLETDRWVPIRFEIDLDIDWADVYYDGTFIAGYVWSAGVFGQNNNGRRSIAAVDLVRDPVVGGASVFFDAIQVTYRGGGFVGTRFCSPAVANSTGLPGTLTAFGSTQAPGDQPLRLHAAGLPPGAPLFLLVARNEDLLPNAFGGQGTLCLGAPIGNAVFSYADGVGRAALDIDANGLPFGGGYAIKPGETWRFQVLYRDRNPGSTTNLTDAVAVSF